MSGTGENRVAPSVDGASGTAVSYPTLRALLVAVLCWAPSLAAVIAAGQRANIYYVIALLLVGFILTWTLAEAFALWRGTTEAAKPLTPSSDVDGGAGRMADRPGDPTEADVMAEIRDVHALVRDVGAEVRDERDRLAARLSEAEQLNETLRRALAEAQAFNAEGSRRLSVYEQALRELTEPWEADCEDCADEDGFCDVHRAQFRNGLALARAALTSEPGHPAT